MPETMTVIESWVRDRGKLHFTLIDPDKQSPDKAAGMAQMVGDMGSDAIMVGGSTAGSDITDECVRAIKNSSSLPVILFPSTAGGVSPLADYLFFMMLMNSRSPRFLVQEQAKAAPHLSSMRVEPISMGYVIISTSRKPTTVETIGEVDRIGKKDVEKAVAYALTAKYYGMSCIYLEAGSGADHPVNPEVISNVKEETGLPLIVGGGVRSTGDTQKVLDAGADVLVTGTIAERDTKMLAEIISTVKQ